VDLNLDFDVSFLPQRLQWTFISEAVARDVHAWLGKAAPDTFQDVQLLSHIIEKETWNRVAALPGLRPVAREHIFHDVLDTLRATGEPEEVKDAAYLVIRRLLGCDWSAGANKPERHDRQQPDADDGQPPW
jgi:hypothetical protein